MNLTQEEFEKLQNQIPYTLKVRRQRLDSVVQELNRRNFKALDDADREDLARICQIISDMFPDTSQRKIVEYAHVAIRLWNKGRSQ